LAVTAVVVVVAGAPSVQGTGFHGSDCVLVTTLPGMAVGVVDEPGVVVVVVVVVSTVNPGLATHSITLFPVRSGLAT
jgi:hypothetical protein